MSEDDNENIADESAPVAKQGSVTESPPVEAADNYSAASLQDFSGEGRPNNRLSDQDINLDVILDVPVTISVEIGRTQVPIRDLLSYSQGSVIELDRLISEPLDVLVNNTLIAHGEVVVVDDQFGIRLTDVISPSERVKKLR